jgi:hypothetical protein
MKTLKLYIISAILISISSCSTAQNNTSEKQAENVLLEFYTKHFQVWGIPSLPSDVRYEKLDSLMQKYCTSKLRKEAREAYENVGVDFLTNDLIGNSNENLKVERDTTNENGYIVSFLSDIATYADPPSGQTKKQVTIHVTVIKEGNNYKINYVR